MPIENGNKVKIEYTGTFEDGTVFDSSEKHGKPLEFKVGEGQIIKGFETAIIGMEKDEEKEVTIAPEDGYGMPNPQMVQELPKEKLQSDQEIKAGMMLMVSLSNGQQMPAKIIDVTDDKVKIDLNHPLAGKTLKFKLKIVSFE